MSENAAETMTAKATTEAALDVNKKLPVWKKSDTALVRSVLSVPGH